MTKLNSIHKMCRIYGQDRKLWLRDKNFKYKRKHNRKWWRAWYKRQFAELKGTEDMIFIR